MGPEEPLLARLDAEGRVATSLGSTTVFFGSDPGALFYVSDTQINVQVPYSVAGASSVQIRIANDGFETNTITVPVAPSAPGIFSSDASGSGQAAAVDINGNLNTAANPVRAGDIIIIFATGEGQTVPPGVTGKLAVAPFPVPVLQVKLLIGGIESQLLYAGAAPGFAGLLQLNAVVPAGIGLPAPLSSAEGSTPRVGQSGSGIPVELIIGENSSQPDLFLNFNPGGGTGVGVPTANPRTVTTNEDTTVSFTLTGSDPEGAPLTFSVLSGPINGTLAFVGPTTINSATVEYTPKANYNGPDSFQFRVVDPDNNSASATVGITVLPVNDPPNAVDDSRNTDAGESVTINVLSNDSDPDGDPLTVTAVGSPANGTAGTNGTTVLYTPASGFIGTDTFSYTISDGTLTDSATIRVNVRGSGNEEPSADLIRVMTNQGVPVLITLVGEDNDGDDLAFSLTGSPSNGTLGVLNKISRTRAEITYTPN
ncbi:MAG TPA: Ig-like domain-containing protein, partial [Verrucomicrobiae bacterium]|nr:Ig-like domain-containing protein [Verrucomicrobiae bacterium]